MSKIPAIFHSEFKLSRQWLAISLFSTTLLCLEINKREEEEATKRHRSWLQWPQRRMKGGPPKSQYQQDRASSLSRAARGAMRSPGDGHFAGHIQLAPINWRLHHQPEGDWKGTRHGRRYSADWCWGQQEKQQPTSYFFHLICHCKCLRGGLREGH